MQMKFESFAEGENYHYWTVTHTKLSYAFVIPRILWTLCWFLSFLKLDIMCVLYGKEQLRDSAFIFNFVFHGQFLCFCECSVNNGRAPLQPPPTFLAIAEPHYKVLMKAMGV